MFSKMYLQTDGVCSRQQFWLWGIIPFSIISVLLYTLVWFRFLDGYLQLFAGVLFLWPLLLIAIKRLRSIGLSGWYILIMLAPIPYAPALVYLVLGFIPDKYEDVISADDE